MTLENLDVKVGDRIVCVGECSAKGDFGTVVGREFGLLSVVWLDWPDEGADEISASLVRTVSESYFQVEALEVRLERGSWCGVRTARDGQ